MKTSRTFENPSVQAGSWKSSYTKLQRHRETTGLRHVFFCNPVFRAFASGAGRLEPFWSAVARHRFGWSVAAGVLRRLGIQGAVKPAHSKKPRPALPGSPVLLIVLLFAAMMGMKGVHAQTWTGGGTNRNWTTIGNWNPAAAIPTNTVILFNETDSLESYSDPNDYTATIVNGDMTIGGLRFQPITSGGAAAAQRHTVTHAVEILDGATLNITASAALDLGNTTTLSNLTVNAIFSGDGTLNINNSSGVIDIGTSRTAGGDAATENKHLLDLRKLGAFQANISTLNVGGNDGHRAQGTMLLSNTYNSITANTINVGLSGGGGNPGSNAVLTLGEGENIIKTTTLTIGTSKQTSGLMNFANATGPGRLELGGKTEGTGVNINVGLATSSTGGNIGGVLDLRGHHVEVFANTLTIGRRTVGTSTSAEAVTGTVHFDQGTFTANHVLLALRNGAGATGGAVGTLNVGGGAKTATFIVNEGGTFQLARNEGTTTGGNNRATGTLNIYAGGTVISHADITDGGSTTAVEARSIINLEGGTLNMMGHNIGNTNNVIDVINFNAGTLMNVGQINGGTGLTKSGTEMLVLEGVNSYTGGTTISGGTLQVGSGGTGGNLGSGNVTINGTGILAFNRSDLLLVEQNLSSGFNAQMIQRGSGRTMLAGNNTGFTGIVTVESGILQAANASALSKASELVVKNSGEFHFVTGTAGQTLLLDDVELIFGLQNGSTVGVELGSTIDVDAAASTAGNVTVKLFGNPNLANPAGNHVLLRANSGLSGAAYDLRLYGATDFTVTSFNTSNTEISVNVALATELPAAWWLGGQVEDYENVWAVSSMTTSNWVTTAGGGVTALTPGAGTAVHLSASGGNASNMTLGADMSIGSLSIHDGTAVAIHDLLHTLTINDDAALTVDAGAGTVQLDTHLNLAGSAPEIAIDGSRLVIVTGDIAGGGFAKTGTGTLRLSGVLQRTLSGDVEVHDGVLELGVGGGFDAISTGLLIGDGSAPPATVKLLAAGQIADSANVTINSDGTLDLAGYSETFDGLYGTAGGVLTSTATGTAVLTLGANNEANASYGGILQNGGVDQLLALVKVGTGTQVLAGANSTYSGGTTVQAGILRLAANNALGNGALTVQGAELDTGSGAFASTVGLVTLTGNGSISGNGTLSSAAGFEVTGGLISANLAGAGALNKTTTGTLTLSGVNSYTGGTNILAGTVMLGADGALPAGGNVVMGQGTAAVTINLNGTSQSIGALNVNTTTWGTLSPDNGQGVISNPNVIIIDAGETLTVTGNIQVGVTATGTSSAGLNMTGGGNLVVNNEGGTIRVAHHTSGTSVNTRAMLDLSGLNSFTANLGASGAIHVGAGDNASGSFSVLRLAEDNNITAGTINVGASAQGALQLLVFGSGENIIKTNTFNVGTGSRDRGVVQFATGDTTGTISLSGIADGTRTNFNMMTGTSATGGTGIGSTFDVRGHEASLLLNNVSIGTQPRATSITAGFYFDQGTLDMNTLTVATRGNSGTNGTAGVGERPTTVTVNLGGGETVINSGIIAFGRVTGATVSGTDVSKNRIADATLNIYGDAEVDIHAAADGRAISMAGATRPTNDGVGNSTANGTINIEDQSVVTVHGNIVKEGGTGVTTAIINLRGVATLDLTGHYVQADNFNLESGTLQNLGEYYHGSFFESATPTPAMVADLLKTTSGTLVLEGVNTYSGLTRILDGTVRVGSGGATGTLGLGNVTLEAATSMLAFNRSNFYQVTQDISGSGGVRQIGTGHTLLGGVNTYSGGTVVSAGILEIQDASALGTGGLTVENGGAFHYKPGSTGEITAIDTFNLNQSLTLQGGSAVGLEFGQTLASNGVANTNGTVELQLYQNDGQSFASGLFMGGELTYNLLQAAGGLNNASYQLLLFNVTDYTVALNAATANGVSVTIQEVDAGSLPEGAVWYGGGVNGYENVWAVARGANTNWGRDFNTGPNLNLAPGANTGVVVSNTTAPAAQHLNNMTLGADMSVRALIFYTGGLGSNPMTLQDASYGLTIKGEWDFTGGGNEYALYSDNPAKVTVATKHLELQAADPTIHVEAGSEMELRTELRGNAFEKTGAGTLILSGNSANTSTGVVKVSGGELQLGKESGVGAIVGDLEIGDGVGTDRVRLLASGQFAHAANVQINSGAFLTLNGFDATINELTGTGRVQNGVTGTATLTVGADDGSSVFDGILENGTGTLALTKVGTGTLTLNNINTYTGITSVLGGTLRYGVNNVISTGAVTVNGGILDMNGFSDTVGQITVANGGKIIGAGSTLTSTSLRQMQDGEVSVRLAGSGGLTKSTSGTVVLSGDNTFTGNVTVSNGTLLITHSRALGATAKTVTISGSSQAPSLALQGDITVSLNALVTSGAGNAAAPGALYNASGHNTISVINNITLTGGNGSSTFFSAAGTLTLNATNLTTNEANRQLFLDGSGDGVINANIINGTTAALPVIKNGTGTWTLSGSNTYTGATTVNAGTLRITNKNGLSGTSGLTVNTGAGFQYQSGVLGNNTTENLTVSTMTLNGGSRVGVELGNLIQVTGAANTNGTITVDVFGISGVNYTSGQYNVITATGGLAGATYVLGNYYNLTNFTVDGVGSEASRVYLNISVVAASAGPFYWKGGYTDHKNVWAITNGLTTGGMSNWSLAADGSVDTALIPGSTANVVFAAAGATNQADPMTLGASMNIGTLMFNDNDGNTVWLDDNANTLTLHGQNAITVNLDAGLVTLNTKLAFAHTDARVNVTAGEELALGAILGTNGFTKLDGGTLRFVGGIASTTTGDFKMHEGLVILDKAEGVVAISGHLEIGGSGGSTATVRAEAAGQFAVGVDVTINSGGTLELNGYSATFDGLDGSGLLTTAGTGDDTAVTVLTLGAGNEASATFTGMLNEGTGIMALTKLGTGTQVLAGATDYSGDTEVRDGELRLAAGGSIGVVSGTAGSLRIGVGTGSTPRPKMVVEAGAELRVGSGVNSSFEVGRAGTGELDLSASDQFIANVGNFWVAVETTSGASVGLIKLAHDNTITAATEFAMGRSLGSSPGNTTPSTLTFGAGNNVVMTPVMLIGGFKSSASVDIEEGGTLQLGNGSGKTALSIGANIGSTAVSNTSILDLRGGTFKANLGALVIGAKTGGGIGNAIGSLFLGESSGNNVTASSVMIGELTGASGTGTIPQTSGLLRMEGGTFYVENSITLGSLSGSLGTVQGRLELYGGTMTVDLGGNITTTNSARSTSIVELDGGALNMVSGYINVDQFLAKSGTLSNLNELYNGAGAATANVAALTKTTTGILRLTGSNAYTGATHVNEGVFLVNGSHTFAGAYQVESGAKLGGGVAASSGSGGITLAVNNSVTIKTGGTLSVGDLATEASKLAITTSGTGALVFEGNSYLDFDIMSTGGHGASFEASYADQLQITGEFNVGNNVQLRVSAANIDAWLEGDTWRLFDWTGISSLPPGGYGFQFVDLTNVASKGLTWNLDDLYVGGTVTLSVVPEPSRALLILIAAALVTLRRKRRWAA